MSFKVKKRNKTNKAPLVPNGSYMGRVVQVIGLGVQAQSDWQTKETLPSKERVIITVEFPTLRMKVNGEDKPRWFSKQYTVSDHEASTMAKTILPLLDEEDDGDLFKLIGKTVLCGIGLTSGGNNKIAYIAAPMDGVDVGPLENETNAFNFYEPDFDEFLKLRKWQQKVILEAEDYPGSDLEALCDVGEFQID